MKKFLFAAALMLLAACGKDPQETPTPKPDEPVKVASVSLAPESATLEIGDTHQLTATVLPTNADDRKVTWSTSAADVATVSESGLVTAISGGEATITATTVDGAKTATAAITVNAPDPNADLVDGQVVTYIKSTKPHEVPLIFIGEGFTAADMGADGLYRRALARFADGVFEVEPFKTYKEYFTVYFVAAVSYKEGVPNVNGNMGSALESYIDEDGWLVTDIDVVNKYVSKVSTDSEIITVSVIANTQDIDFRSWASVDGPWSGGFSVTDAFAGDPSDNQNWVRSTHLHELGHSFAFLGDEYVEYNMGPNDSDDEFLAEMQGAGYYLNVSSTDDPTKVPWAHLIGHEKYPYVGVYKGAVYLSEGRWRSEETSIMAEMEGNENGIVSYFNAASRELIVKRILKIAGEEYSFDEFVARDKYEPDRIVPFRR